MLFIPNTVKYTPVLNTEGRLTPGTHFCNQQQGEMLLFIDPHHCAAEKPPRKGGGKKREKENRSNTPCFLQPSATRGLSKTHNPDLAPN